jgi:hypothetical protein
MKMWSVFRRIDVNPKKTERVSASIESKKERKKEIMSTNLSFVSFVDDIVEYCLSKLMLDKMRSFDCVFRANQKLREEHILKNVNRKSKIMLTNACLLHSTFTGKIYVNIMVRKS